MKFVLDIVILESQNAFVPERAITDNIFISTKIIHFIKRKKKGKKKVTALKIDMSKRLMTVLNRSSLDLLW